MVKSLRFDNLIKSFLLLLGVLFCLELKAVTYYSDSGGGDPNSVSKWWTVNNNSGSHPGNFGTAGDIFIIQSGHTYTTTNSWTVSATLQIEGMLTIQTANAIKILTIKNGGVLTANAQTTISTAASGGEFNIEDGGKYIFNNTTINTATTLFNGTETFGSNSTIEYQSFETTTGAFVTCLIASSTNYGNIIWNIQAGTTGYALNTSNVTNRMINGNFTLTKTGASGSLSWCASGNVSKLTINGNYSQSGGTFIISKSGNGNDGSILEVLGDFTLSGGVFDFGSGAYDGILYLAGDFTMTNGTFYYSYASAFGSGGYMYFTGNSTQIFSQTGGTWTADWLLFTINSGAIVQFASNMTLPVTACTLTVLSGGTLDIPNPYYTTGSGKTIINSGGTLRTGHVDGISTTASTGCVQTTTRTYNTGGTYIYNGTAAQVTGNGISTCAGLTFNNPSTITLSQDITVSNGGTFSLVQGYHDLDSLTLSIGTSAAANTLSYTAGGLFCSGNVGNLKRYIPSGATITYNSGNYYGLFPFSKSTGQFGIVKIETSGTVTTGGYISIVPTFDFSNILSGLNVADGSNTIKIAEVGQAYFDVTVNSITGGTATRIQYDCGEQRRGKKRDKMCLATYNSNVIGVLGTHSANIGVETLPQVIRTAIANISSLNSNRFCLASYDDKTENLEPLCDKGGTYKIGPNSSDYLTLDEALDDLSSNGLTYSVILELEDDYTDDDENFPLKIDPFNCLGSSNSLIIRPETGATSLVITDDKKDLIQISKGDYVTIDGRPGSVGTTSQLTLSTSKVDKITIEFEKDATYNTLKYLTIEGSNTTGGTIEFNTTNLNSGNDYNTVTECTITNYTGEDQYYGINSNGTATKTNDNITISNNNFVDCLGAGINVATNSSGWTITGNSFYQSASFTPANDIYGILINTGSGYTISGNYIGGQAASCGGSSYTLNSSARRFLPIYLNTDAFSTSSIQGNIIRNIALNTTLGTATTSGIFTGIFVTGAGALNIGNVSANIIGDTTTSASNKITITSSTSGGWINGIYSNTSGTTTISNNLIGDFATSNVSGKGYSFYGIQTLGSGANTISNNKIGSISTANTIAIGGASTAAGVCQFYGINNSATGLTSITSNRIQNIGVYGTGASKLYGVYNASTPTSSSISQNTIGRISTVSTGTAGIVIGIENTAAPITNISNNIIDSAIINNGYFIGINDNIASAVSHIISNNAVGSSNSGNITINSTSTTASVGINLANTGTYTCSENSVKGLKNTANTTISLYGIQLGSTGSYTLTENTVQTLSHSNTGSNVSKVHGINVAGSPTYSMMNRNKILYLENLSSSTTSILSGIYYVSAGTNTLQNNLIKLTNASSSVGKKLYGAYINNSSSMNVYNNSIFIGGGETSGGSANCYSYGLYAVNTIASFNVKNNIFQNQRTTTSNRHYAVRINNATGSTFDSNYGEVENSTYYAAIGATDYTAITWDALGTVSNEVDGSTLDISIGDDGALSTADLSNVTAGTSGLGFTIDINSTPRTSYIRGCYEGTAGYYWVGGNGVWSAYASHWVKSSGGSEFHASTPTSSDRVFIDENSSGIITVDETANCAGLFYSLNGGELTVGTQTLNIEGDLNLGTGGLITCSTGTIELTGEIDATGGTITYSGAGNLNLNGETVTSLGTFTPGSSTVNYGYVGNQTIATATYYNLTLGGGSNGIKSLSGTTTVSGNLTINASTELSDNTKTLNCDGDGTINGTLTISTGSINIDGTFDATSGNVTFTGAGNLYLGGTVTSIGTFTKNTGTIHYDKSGDQTVLAETYYNLTSGGSGTKTLAGNTYVQNILDFSADSKIATSDKILNIGIEGVSDGSITNYSSTRYIIAYHNGGDIGSLNHYINNNATYVYPIGDLTNYTPLTFELTANGGLSNAALNCHTNPTKISDLDATLTTYIERYWEIFETGFTTPTYNVSYTYVDGDIVGTEEDLLPIKKSGATWYKPTGSNFTEGTEQGSGSLSTLTNTLTWTGLTTFSLLNGAGEPTASPLPITLIEFIGKQVNGKNQLSWKTASEKNNDYFVIERTFDNNNFELIGSVLSVGNSNTIQNYTLIDSNPFRGINYYRLKQVDNDGEFTFSKLISIDNTDGKTIVSRHNLLGQKVDESYQGLVILLFSDGSSMKIIQ